MIKLKIKKGDQVIVCTGKDKGHTGQVIKVIPKKNKAVVSGANIVKKHTKPSKQSEGGIISKEMPIHISNLSILDPKLGKATKIGYKKLEDGTKVRFAKLSGELIDNEGAK
ncbi:MAG: 50S ribosomal protein L24 [Rickettsiaceae bacterium]|nr:50S ribosomal protein L24 [Rickettsiaceae bacterium]